MKNEVILVITFVYLVLKFLSNRKGLFYNLRGVLLLTIPTLGLIMPQAINSIIIIILLAVTILDDQNINLKMLNLLLILQIYFILNIKINYPNNNYLKDFNPYVGMFEYMTYFIFFYILSIKQKYNDLLPKVIDSILTYSITIFSIGIFDWVNTFISTGTFSRVTSVFSNANGFGPYSAFILILSFMNHEKNDKNTIVRILSIIAIFLSGSRVVWVAIFIASIFYLFKFENLWFVKQIKYVFIGIILYLFLPNSITEFIYDRISTMFQTGDASTSDRLNLFRFSIELFKDKPFLGHGIRSYHEHMINKSLYLNSSNVHHPHNALLESLVTLGIVGTILIALTIVVFSKNQYKKAGKNKLDCIFNNKYVITFVVYIICFSMFSRLLNHYEITIYFLLTTSAILNYRFKIERRIQD